MGEDPVEAVAQTLGVGGCAGLRDAEAQGGADDGVPTAQGGADFGVGRAGELGLDELAGDVEGDLLLLVAAACGQDGAALFRRAAADFGEECGLAEAGVTREGEERAAGAERGADDTVAQSGQLAQRLVGGGQFGLPLQEPAPGHGAPPARACAPARRAGPGLVRP